ncbi:hypothetical protein PanWU01x14_010450, partial [Parasponia andersonii]
VRQSSFTRIGVIIWDSNRVVSSALACRFPRNFNSLLDHCLAIREGLKFCIAKSIRVNEVEVSSLLFIPSRKIFLFQHLALLSLTLESSVICWVTLVVSLFLYLVTKLPIT